MRKPILTLMAVALVLAGCTTVGPDYKRPEVDLPQAWNVTAAVSAPLAPPEKWWTVYGDADLDRLMEEAMAANRDIKAAVARIEASRAALAITDADRFPVVTGNAGRSRTKSTERGATPIFPGVPVEYNDMRATVQASYEIDFWGKFARATEAARADLLATTAGRDAVRLTLSADVARAYFNLRNLDAQHKVAARTLETREQLVALTAKRFEAGVANEFDLRQVEAERDNARVALANIARDRESGDARLSVLLGRSPKAVWQDKAVGPGEGAKPGIAVAVPAGLPSQLLERRPDIREAEQRLIAASARIGAARAQFFPAISLTGFLGTASAALSNLFSGPSLIWQFAAGASQPIWNAGRLDAQVESANARQREALANYEKAIQSAFADVRVALAAHTAAAENAATQGRRSEALAQALKLARLRYDNGVASLIDVLDAERNLLGAELSRLDALAAQQGALADLVKALGGGWGDGARAG
jgi:multidrug efflux system outer membrane protein